MRNCEVEGFLGIGCRKSEDECLLLQNALDLPEKANELKNARREMETRYTGCDRQGEVIRTIEQQLQNLGS